MEKNINRLIIVILLFFSVLIVPNKILSSVKIEIKQGLENRVCQRIEKKLTILINEINNAAENNIDLDDSVLDETCNTVGKSKILNVFNKVKFFTTFSNLELTAYPLHDNDLFDVRNVNVTIVSKLPAGKQHDNIVFTVNNDGYIVNFRFALQDTLYTKLKKECENTENQCKILHVAEDIKTAYCTNDIDFLNHVFDDDILVVDGLRKDKNSRKKRQEKFQGDYFKYLKQSKLGYLKILKALYTKTKYPEYEIMNIETKKINEDKIIYAIDMKQTIKSINLVQTGYFLIICELDETRSMPLIKRIQRIPLEINDVFSLDDFVAIQ